MLLPPPSKHCDSSVRPLTPNHHISTPYIPQILFAILVKIALPLSCSLVQYRAGKPLSQTHDSREPSQPWVGHAGLSGLSLLSLAGIPPFTSPLRIFVLLSDCCLLLSRTHRDCRAATSTQGDVDEAQREDEAGAEGRHKPEDLEQWFDEKEKKIGELTTFLKDVCKEMADLNQTARDGISARETEARV